MTGIIALVDYGAGNLHSVHNALKKAGGVHVEVTSDPALVRGAARVVLPGVGAFRACRDALAAVPGMIEAMAEAVLERGVHFLGICVGIQLLAERGAEYGSHERWEEHTSELQSLIRISFGVFCLSKHIIITLYTIMTN